MRLKWVVYNKGSPQNLIPEQQNSQGQPAAAVLNAGSYIQYLPKYGHLLCAPCRTALPLERLHTHLRTIHHVYEPHRSAIVAKFEHLPVSRTYEDIKPLPDGSLPLTFLAPPAKGYACQCSFKTISCDVYRKHLKKTHSESWTPSKRVEAECFLQKWSPLKLGGLYEYWQVDATRADQGDWQRKGQDQAYYNNGDTSRITDATSDPELDAILKMEAEEEARLAGIGQGGMTVAEELEHDENTDWLRGCGWPYWFAHKPLHLIAATARAPSPQDEGYLLGLWNCVEWVSPAAVEANLRQLVELMGLVMDRCEQTLAQTPRVLCCWLRSWGRFYAYPFALPQRHRTRQRYYSYLSRFLCYVFRAWRLCSTLKQNMQEIYGLRISAAQRQTMEFVWGEITCLVESEGIATAPPRLLEAVFQLLVQFWTDISIDGRTEEKAIAHFSGVLGIHPQELAFRTAYDYTPFLSALIWVGRLVILEYALPLHPYQTLQVPWPERATYPSQVDRLCNQIQPKYLQRGSPSPIGYLIERLQHGRAVAKHEGARTNISWSLDGQTIGIDGFQLSMQQLRQAIHHLLARTEHEARKLMFNQWPKTDLSRIKDSLVMHRPGFSFVYEPANQLQGGFKILSRQAFSKDHGGFALAGAGRDRAIAYLRRRDRFVRRLFAAIHLSSGMPARGEELRMIRWADTTAVPRNIFIYNGRVMLVFSYNKATTKSNNSFYIVRFPCPIVERVLFNYLAYIRPFSDFLTRQLKIVQDLSSNPHLFTVYKDATACFSAAACTKSLQQSTTESPVPLTIKRYRQIAVSIAKKHMSTLLQPFDPNVPRDYDGFLRLLSFQTGHKPSTQANAYALDRAFPAKLQADLIERYYQNSHAWHSFIGITEDDPLTVDVSSDVELDTPKDCVQAPGYYPDSIVAITSPTQDVDFSDENSSGSLSSSDSDLYIAPATRSSKSRAKRKCKDVLEDSTLKKIKLMQDRLAKLEKQYYEEQGKRHNYHVLVCKQHATAIQNLDAHLLQHHAVAKQDRSRITEYYNDRYWIKKPEEVALPSLLERPIQELGEPLDGFQCQCTDGNNSNCGFITVNINVLRVHCKTVHKQRWLGDTNSLYQKVKVQTFFRVRHLRRYFVVRALEQSSSSYNTRQFHPDDDTANLLAKWKATQQEADERAQVIDAEAAKTDRTGWFNRTGWLTHLAKRNRIHLARAIRLPSKEEVKLKRAATAVERLVERSVDGLSSLPRETRRWLKSAHATEIDVRPLGRLQNPESQARYAGYMVMFVCYFLRIVADEEARERGSSSDSSDDESGDSSESGSSEDEDSRVWSRGARREAPDVMKDARELFRWQGRQKELAQALWLVLNDVGEEAEKAQADAVLEVLAAFIFTPTDSSVFESGLVHFLAVLGIDAEMDRLRTAKNYSYMLAGIVYCMRVIGVEALLPAAHREAQGADERERFLEQRRRFLADGSYSPMSEILSLLAYGKFVALNAGNSGNAYWSQDKKIFYLHGKPIVIRQFQQMAQDMVTELENRLWQELLWISHPADRFSTRLDLIQDDVTFTRRGMSFVTNHNNGLDNGLEWMLGRMKTISEGQKLRRDRSWRKQWVKQYLRQVNRFLELLLMCVHTTSGQPGRGTEVTTMRHRNGALQDRNIFVVDGQVMTVVRYYKSQSQWDKPKVVPRFLPARLSQVMVTYLAYVQPLQEYLTVQVLEGSFSDYVWADEQGPWGTEKLTRVLKQETGKRLGYPLTTLDYRHTAVGIGRVVVGDLFGRGYQDEVGEVEEAEVEDNGENPLELQSSRTTQMGISHYSVPVDIVKHLSIRAMEAFRQVSAAWHNFLGLGVQEKRLENGPKTVPHQPTSGHKRQHSDRLGGGYEGIQPQRKQIRLPGSTEEELGKAMQQVLGRSDVRFKSAEQEQAMRAVLARQTPLVVVLPTGGGKSLLFTVPACLPDAGVTVVVVPYRALIDDLVNRITQAGIDCTEWKLG